MAIINGNELLLAAIQGKDGKSAYEIWREQGNTGSETDFLNSLKGQDGEKGATGNTGATGEQGKSAYDVWREQGNVGTEADFINSLKGEKGATGEQGYFSIVRWI